jgi:hypothetical protein
MPADDLARLKTLIGKLGKLPPIADVSAAEIVERINLLADHSRVGIFAPLQEAAVAALTGPQDSVEERRRRYIDAMLAPLAREVDRLGFEVAVGSSGTIEAVASIIHAACQVSSRAASISVAISAMRKLTPWLIAIGLPNWTRSFAYSTASSYAAWATPTAPMAVPGRLKSSVCIAILKPSPSSPRRFLTGTTASTKATAAPPRGSGRGRPQPDLYHNCIQRRSHLWSRQLCGAVRYFAGERELCFGHPKSGYLYWHERDHLFVRFHARRN